jgi:hypothetical protein
MLLRNTDVQPFEAALGTPPITNNCWLWIPTPRFPALTLLLDAIVSALEKHGDTACPELFAGLALKAFKYTGPEILRKTMVEYAQRNGGHTIAWVPSCLLEPVTTANLHMDVSGSAARAKFPWAFAIHHPEGSWVAVPGAHMIGRAWSRWRSDSVGLSVGCFVFLMLAVLTLVCVILGYEMAKWRRRQIHKSVRVRKVGGT